MPHPRVLLFAGLAVGLALLAGLIGFCPCANCDCQPSEEPPAARVPQEPEVPIANIPRALREWNWGGGSCVHASNVMQLRWQNQMELAAWWRKTYAGGESYQGLTSKLQRAGVPYYSTANGDVSILERASQERRAAVIFYYPNHSILFVHIDAQRAIVLDNNRIEAYIEIPREQFISAWKSYGGVAIVPTVGSPAPPLPWF